MAINHNNSLDESAEKNIEIKATEAANIAKSQILVNASHRILLFHCYVHYKIFIFANLILNLIIELRTPLEAIINILSALEHVALTDDQKDMINIMSCASDIVLSIINDILDTARLKVQKVILINRIFYLSDLLEGTIEKYRKKANDKKIELILNCDVDVVSRYVKSDPKR